MRLKSWKSLIKYSIFAMLFIVVILKVPLISFLKYKTLNELTQNYTYLKEPAAKKDWHDWVAILMDHKRVGLGEQGKPAKLGNNTDRVLEEKLYKQHGLNALLSDAISVNRSVLDARDKGCLYKKYLSKLPTVSIVIPFHNELFSTFARTLHSLINRTPPELLKEIILVDDFSDLEFFVKLEKYVAAHFTKVRFVRMPERMGLIRARLAGIQKATADVLVIFDAHIEVGYNWLPPLLEPIALNRRTVVCPFIDWIVSGNLGYFGIAPNQGAFDWNLAYRDTEVFPKDLKNKTEPYNNPIMLGGLFAMSRDYFWELGGYDEGLQIWGGEQYELSFKVWMCGGQILNAPCSRVAHHFRGSLNKGLNANVPNYLMKNKKRIVEVWLDDYKKYFYKRHQSYVEKMDVGDLTKQKALREKLQCKTFDWYLHEIAINVLTYFPPVQPFEYAVGAIQSVGSPDLCVDKLAQESNLILYTCDKNLQAPHDNQMFLLRWSRDLRWRSYPQCLDVPQLKRNASVVVYSCHNKGGAQFWYYDRKTKWLINRPHGNYCLEAFPQNTIRMSLYMNICDKDNVNMKWNFGAVNDTALDRFYENLKV